MNKKDYGSIGQIPFSLAKNHPTLPIIAALFVVFSIVSPFFMTTGNLQAMLSSNMVTMIGAIGETFVLLTGGIDLSISTVISCSAVISGTVMAQTGNIFLGVVVAIAVGLVFGLINGYLIGYSGMTPFITTMGTQLIARGIAFVVSQGIAVKNTPKALIYFGFNTTFGIPNICWISIVLLIFSSLLFSQTDWGRQVLLFGSNRNSAKYTGIDVKKIEMSVYVLSGIMGGIAGFISICNLGNAIPGVGDKLLLMIIGGVILGGTNMNGGEGSIIRTLIGVMLLAILTSGLNLMGIPFYDQLIIQGLLIFIGNSLATGISAKTSFAMK